MSHALRSITDLISQEYAHELGVAILVQDDGRGPQYTDAVVQVSDGQILAYDGWYGLRAHLASDNLTPLTDFLPQMRHGDSPSGALEDRNGAWLPALAESLSPSYAFADMAVRTLRNHGNLGARDLPADCHAVAYFPTQLTIDEAAHLVSNRKLNWPLGWPNAMTGNVLLDDEQLQ